jgi:hypothetical protein
MTLVCVLACLAVCLCVASSAFAADLYVAPGGDDASPGTRDKPLASLAGARDAVRRLKKQKPPRDITVELAGGTYRLGETVIFGLDDSAAEGCTITYAAAAGERPMFSAGVPIGGWEKLKDYPKLLPAKARGKVYVADLPDGLERFYTLFNGANRLPRARREGFLPTGKAEGWTGEDQNTFRFPAGAMRKWKNLADVEISVVGAAPWTMNVLPLESVDTKSRTARTAMRATYALSQPRFGHFESGSIFVENTFCGLDAPGKWVLDSAARKVYLWPAKGTPGRNILAPKLTEFIRVEGRIDYDGPADEPVRGIIFRGLTFTHGERYTWPADRLGWGLQHDWEMFDKPSAMVRFRGAERCGVEACRFANSGGTAIRLDLHCQNNRIADNVIEHVGGAGVLLAGYGPGTKDANKRNEVTNNHIHHVGETYWHSAAIWCWQSGENLIANNLIHNTPYTAICVTGRINWDKSGRSECSRTVRWAELEKALGGEKKVRGHLPWKTREQFLHARKNIVERNEIHDVMEVLEDGNCIYVSGCGAGNVVRENYLHDCASIHMAEGIRCDDDQHETIIDGNILYRIGGLATYIATKGVNHITNNIMACPAAPTHRGMLSLEHTPIEGSIIQRNIIYAVNRKDIPCYQGTTYYKTVTRLADCKADYNVWYNAADPNWGKQFIEAERKNGVELNSAAADPMFVNIEKGDLRLKKNSPALKLGFRPIDMKQIGLRGPVGPAAMGK